jgi:general stress protein YciG
MDQPKSNRGFASMDPERLRELASSGGKAAHRNGKAHRWNTKEAREAGKKGGAIVAQDRARMAELGRLGGKARAKKREEVSNGE